MSDERLRVGIIAPPWVPVPPPVYGGTELVIDLLARGLTEAGHEVELFTTGDSTCPVPRRWLFAHARGTIPDWGLELEHVRAAYATLDGVDLVHDHTTVGPAWAHRLRPDLPVVATNHNPFGPDLLAHYERAGRDVALVAISHHQRASAPTVPFAAVIHHGLDVAAIPVGAGDGGYVAFLGRMSPDKGADRAIRVARAAGRRILIAAKLQQPDEHRYYEESVAPLLGEDAVYVGEVGAPTKYALLGDAEALVNPIRWPEPFGLVMVESLACGTPVVSFAEGAAPEIVDDGLTGFLCRDEDDMVAALDQLDRIDRRACRAAAARHFSLERFVEEHVLLYRRVLRSAAQRSAAPAAG